MEKLPRESLLDWKFGIYFFAIIASVATGTILTGSFRIDSNVSSAIGLFVLLVCFFPALTPRDKRTWRAFAWNLILAVVFAFVDFVALSVSHRYFF